MIRKLILCALVMIDLPVGTSQPNIVFVEVDDLTLRFRNCLAEFVVTAVADSNSVKRTQYDRIP